MRVEAKGSSSCVYYVITSRACDVANYVIFLVLFTFHLVFIFTGSSRVSNLNNFNILASYSLHHSFKMGKENSVQPPATTVVSRRGGNKRKTTNNVEQAGGGQEQQLPSTSKRSRSSTPGQFSSNLRNRSNLRYLGANNNATMTFNKFARDFKSLRNNHSVKTRSMSAKEGSQQFCDVVGTVNQGDEEEEISADDMDDRIRVSVSANEDSEFPAPDDEMGNSDEEYDNNTGKLISESNDPDEHGSLETEEETEITFKNVDSHFVELQPRDGSANYDSLRGDPAFENYIKRMVAKELKDERERALKQTVAVTPRTPVNTGVPRVQKTQARHTFPGVSNTHGNKGKSMVKSPSDTTLYAPALNKTAVGRRQLAVDTILNEPVQPQETDSGGIDNFVNLNLDEQVNQFIEGIKQQMQDKRIVQKKGASSESEGVAAVPQCVAEPVPGTSAEDVMYQENVDIAKRKANEMILEAERFKATVNTPPGNASHNLDFVNEGENVIPLNENKLVDDDSFFHVTCHLDPTLRVKIARGDFVELERLLPKQRGFSDENRMNIVQKDGKAYFVPVQNNGSKINSVRKWEQAFRIYAAVYSEANPSRAAEIWQYVHVINIAAASYVWDNVSYYDTTFRHLMAQNPGRSWSKIYNQMWNIAMREPLLRTNNGAPYFGSNNNNQGSYNGSRKLSQNTSGGKRKPKYCWAHNRGSTCKDGKNCKYIHRCSFCDAGDHTKNVCAKNTGNN